MPPSGVRVGTNVQYAAPCCVTVRPAITPIADPKTTSLASCTLSCSRDEATSPAIT